MKQDIVRTSKEPVRDIVVYNVPQKKCWALAAEQLQPFIQLNVDWNTISREELAKKIPLDENFLYRFEIDKHSIAEHRRKQALSELLDMSRIKISGTDNSGRNYSFFFLSGLIEDGGKLYGTITVQGLRWILDFGQKQMFVAFHKPSFLKLTTGYSMDLFLLLSENYKRCIFDISLEAFKQRLGCPESYDAQDIKKRILLPARKEYQDKQSAISFDAEFYSKNDKETTPGRKRLNMIKFMVLKRNENGKLNPTDE